jgi:hypothetical protein
MSLFPMYDEKRDYSGVMQAVAARKPVTGTLTAIADLPISKQTALKYVSNLLRNLPKLKRNPKIPTWIGLQSNLNAAFEKYLEDCAETWASHVNGTVEFSRDDVIARLNPVGIQPDVAFVEAAKEALTVFPYRKGDSVVLASRTMNSAVMLLCAMLALEDDPDADLRTLGDAREIRKFLRWNDKPIPAMHASSLGALLTQGPMYKHENTPL